MATPYNLNKWFREIELGKNGHSGSLQTDSSGRLLYYERQNANLIQLDEELVHCHRQNFTVAQATAVATILPAIPGLAYRMVDCRIIARGGDAATSTSIDITATRSAAAVILVSFATTTLDDDEIHYDGESSVGTILADGASYTALDVNTAITLTEVGDATTGATSFDVIISYCLQA